MLESLKCKIKSIHLWGRASFLLLHTFANLIKRAPCLPPSIFCLFVSFYGYESINIIEENRGVNIFVLIWGYNILKNWYRWKLKKICLISIITSRSEKKFHYLKCPQWGCRPKKRLFLVRLCLLIWGRKHFRTYLYL